jgi:hypothetical protein
MIFLETFLPRTAMIPISIRVLRLFKRKEDVERCPNVFFALSINKTMMQVNDLPANSQSDTRAGCIVLVMEALKNSKYLVAQ